MPHFLWNILFIFMIHWAFDRTVKTYLILRGPQIVSNIPPKQHTIPANVLPNDSEDLFVTTPPLTSPPQPLNIMRFSILSWNPLHLKKRIRFCDKNQNALDFTIKKIIIVSPKENQKKIIIVSPKENPVLLYRDFNCFSSLKIQRISVVLLYEVFASHLLLSPPHLLIFLC